MTTPFWQFKTKNFVPYQNTLAAASAERKGIAGPANDEEEGLELGSQALVDWNRFKAHYYINGQSLKELHPEDFTLRTLKAFIRKHLLQDFSILSNEREALLNQCLRHFHQSGIPHATAMAVTQRNSACHDASDPQARYDGVKREPDHMRIDFVSTEHGIAIREANTYCTIESSYGNETRPFQAADGQYYAKTVTDSLLSLDGQVSVENVTVDCQHPALTKIFDQRSLWEKVNDFFQSLWGNNTVAALPSPGR